MEAANSKGATDLGMEPLSHEEDQNKACLPSPTVTEVAAPKRALSDSSFGVSKPIQGLSGVFHSYHSQRSWKALANLSESGDAQTAEILGAANLEPVDLTFSTGNLVATSPKHSTEGVLQVANFASSSIANLHD